MRKEHFQVVVIGAGVAGVAAAVSAARHGAKTVLIEAGVCAGGMGSAGLVPSFTPFSYKPRPIVAGFAGELYKRLQDIGGSNEGDWPFLDAEYFKLVCDDLLTKAGVDVRYLTVFHHCVTEGKRVKSVILLDRTGELEIEGDNFIDTTGDGALAYNAGVEMKNGDDKGRTQPGSCCFVIAGVDVSKMLPEDMERVCVPGKMVYLTTTLRKYTKIWVEKGYITDTDTFVNHVPGANLDLKTGIARVNFGHLFALGACDPSRLSQMLMEGRRRIREFVECMRNHMPGMENITLVATPSLPDIRESRRIVGRMVMSGKDFWEGATHEDDIAIYDYCVDVHTLDPKDVPPEAKKHDGEIYGAILQTSIDKYYGIPFSITLTKEYDNLAVAGRCVSATQEMLGALRVMPAAMSTGQAVGTAAAMSMPIADVNVKLLQEELKKNGVLLEYKPE